MANLTSADFVDAGIAAARAEQGRTVKVGARIVKVKEPNGLFRRYVDPAGNVVAVQLSDGALTRSVSQKQYRESLVTSAHFIPYGECALRTSALDEADMPAELRTVCTQGSYSEQKACKHVELAISERRKQHEEDERARAVITARELDLEMRKQEIEISRESQRQSKEILDRLTVAVAKGPSK